MKKFAYLFACNGRVEWSSETEETISRRTTKLPVKERVALTMFMKHAAMGSFMEISTGEMIFCTLTA